MNTSPLAPPFTPALPLPERRSWNPSSTPSGIVTVKVLAEGTTTNEHAEEDEEIEIFKFKKEEINNLVKNENIGARDALVMMLFANGGC